MSSSVGFSLVTVCVRRYFFFFSSRRRHTRYWRDWSSDVCSSDLDHVFGLGENENMIASDVAPLLAYTRNIIYLEDGEYAVADQKNVRVFDRADRPVERPPKKIMWDAVMAEKEDRKSVV